MAVALAAAGVPVEYDGGPAGVLGAGEIQRSIEDCAAVVVVMTPESQDLPRVVQELALAERARRPIVPLLLRGQPFARLAGTPYENVTGGRLPSAALVAHVQSLRSVPPAPAAGLRYPVILVGVAVLVLLLGGLATVAVLTVLKASRDVAVDRTPPAVIFEPSRDPSKPVVGKGSGELTSLTVITIIRGTGDPVAIGQSVTADYVGVFYLTGAEFDSSWGQQPFTFVIGEGAVIEGWDQGLVGVPVGSRVQLDIPADLAYGENPTAGQPAGPLRFVVDVLAAR